MQTPIFGMLHPLTSDDGTIPPFEPHPLLRGGHAQTIVGRYLGGERQWLEASRHIIDLPDGDRLLALETVPPNWSDQQPVALIVHGLAGCAQASYVVRLGRHLVRSGIAVVRINLRGAGDGFGLAKGIYHAGRSDDLRVIVEWLHKRRARSPIGLIGFSLGGNLVLKLAIEAAGEVNTGFDAVLAANPPLDLAACAREFSDRRTGSTTGTLSAGYGGWSSGSMRGFPSLGPSNCAA